MVTVVPHLGRRRGPHGMHRRDDHVGGVGRFNGDRGPTPDGQVDPMIASTYSGSHGATVSGLHQGPEIIEQEAAVVLGP